MKINTHINRYSDIVLGWDISNWALESNSVLCYHNSNLSVWQIAASVSWFHNSLIGTPFLFKREHTIWDVKFAIATTWLIYNNCHNWCTIFVIIRKKSWCLFWIWAINLNQMSLWSESTLNCIIQWISVLLLLYCTEPILLLLPHIYFNISYK